jgi:hypothetical protein
MGFQTIRPEREGPPPAWTYLLVAGSVLLAGGAVMMILWTFGEEDAAPAKRSSGELEQKLLPPAATDPSAAPAPAPAGAEAPATGEAPVESGPPGTRVYRTPNIGVRLTQPGGVPLTPEEEAKRPMKSNFDLGTDNIDEMKVPPSREPDRPDTDPR